MAGEKINMKKHLQLICALHLQLHAVLNLCFPNPVFALSIADPPPASMCLNLQPSPDLPPFLDPLTFPPIIDISQGQPITLGAYKISQNVHSQLPNTTFYAWGVSEHTAAVPGPTLLAMQHVRAHVNWENHIRDRTHMMPLDTSIEWANPQNGGVPIVTHLHGGETQPMYDGYPEAWYTSFGDRGSAFITKNYTYINEQQPTTLWYHDHAMGITRLNQVAGLAGMYILRSPAEEASNLPIGLSLQISDRQFFPNGSINFPQDVNRPDVLHHIWCPEYYGDTILVNGKAWPYLTVLPRPYRFRILNSCNARFLVLSFSEPCLLFNQIGTDGGFLEEPMNLSTLTLSPSERIDCIIDFSPLTVGTSVYLNNTGPTPFPLDNLTSNPPKTFAAMKFVVDGDGLAEGTVELPIDVSSLVQDYVPLSEDEAVRTRRMTVRERDIPNTVTPLIYVLANTTWTNKTVSEKPIQGTTEIWELINPRDNGHAVHIHLTQFQVLNHQEIRGDDFLDKKCSLNIDYGTSGSCFTTPAKEPLEYQRGWKDSVIVWPGNVTRIIMRFTQRNGSSFGFDPTEKPGYVWHCHVAGHEDWSMMRPLQIQPPTSTIREKANIVYTLFV